MSAFSTVSLISMMILIVHQILDKLHTIKMSQTFTERMNGLCWQQSDLVNTPNDASNNMIHASNVIKNMDKIQPMKEDQKKKEEQVQIKRQTIKNDHFLNQHGIETIHNIFRNNSNNFNNREQQQHLSDIFTRNMNQFTLLLLKSYEKEEQSLEAEKVEFDMKCNKLQNKTAQFNVAQNTINNNVSASDNTNDTVNSHQSQTQYSSPSYCITNDPKSTQPKSSNNNTNNNKTKSNEDSNTSQNISNSVNENVSDGLAEVNEINSTYVCDIQMDSYNEYIVWFFYGNRQINGKYGGYVVDEPPNDHYEYMVAKSSDCDIDALTPTNNKHDGHIMNEGCILLFFLIMDVNMVFSFMMSVYVVKY